MSRGFFLRGLWSQLLSPEHECRDSLSFGFVQCSCSTFVADRLYPVFFRFVASLILVVLVSMVGIGLEKQTLEMKRAVSRQYFQVDLLLEMHARLRLQVQELTAPANLAKIEAETLSRHSRLPGPTESSPATPPTQVSRGSQLPLLRWEHPAPTRDQ